MHFDKSHDDVEFSSLSDLEGVARASRAYVRVTSSIADSQWRLAQLDLFQWSLNQVPLRKRDDASHLKERGTLNFTMGTV